MKKYKVSTSNRKFIISAQDELCAIKKIKDRITEIQRNSKIYSSLLRDYYEVYANDLTNYLQLKFYKNKDNFMYLYLANRDCSITVFINGNKYASKSWSYKDINGLMKNENEIVDYFNKYVELLQSTKDSKIKDKSITDAKLVISMQTARENLPDIDEDLHWYNTRYGSLNFDKNDSYLTIIGSQSDLDKFVKQYRLDDLIR